MAIKQIGITTEYKADGLGETKPVLRIGGKTEKFVPNVNLSFQCESGSEKYFINLNRKSVTVDKEVSSLVSDKLSISVGNETDIWHINEKGEFEWDIEFKEKPATNVFSWDLLHSEGLEFAYQPALTAEEEQGHDGQNYRPPNVVGSYAVYCGQSGHFKDASGNTIVNYATGKLLHIYRPLCTDAKGKTTWAELLIEHGQLTITIPQKYLDEAVYPVTLDPTFGYTTLGASDRSRSTGNAEAGQLDALSPVAGGTLTNISFGLTPANANASLQFGLYSEAAGPVPNTRLAYNSSFFTAGGVSKTWYTNPVAWSYTLPASATQYWAALLCVDYGVIIHYDTGGSKEEGYDLYESPLPVTLEYARELYNIHFSAYATYTEAGGASSTPSFQYYFNNARP